MPSLPPEVDESLLSSASIVRVDVQQVLRFFDEKPPCSRGHATAIVSLLGEDLAAASLRHCLLANGANSVNVRIETVGTGNRSGPRLDRWIEADLKGGRRILFQTEVKSWSAHAIGGKTLAINASAEETRDYRDAYWKGQWDSRRRTFKWAIVGKVLVHMKCPFEQDDREILPLVIYWAPVAPRKSRYKKSQSTGGHLFSISEPTCDFPFDVPRSWPAEQGFSEVWVFSVSGYLRSLRSATIDLPMPNAAERFAILAQMMQLQ